MAGINRQTGKRIDGWPEVEQALNTLVTTVKGSRVMRRWFGGKLPRLIDRGLSQLTLIEYYAALADTFSAKNEPRFRLAQMRLSENSDLPNGKALFIYEGLYYPNALKGDFSVVETVQGRLIFTDEMLSA